MRNRRFPASLRWASLLFVAACTSVSSHPSTPPLSSAFPPATEAPLHLELLTDLVPSAGLDWMLFVRPAELWNTPALRKPLTTLLPPHNLDKLAEQLGFELRLADELIVASYGTTTLVLIRVAHDPVQVEKRFRERLTSPVERTVEGHRVVRIGGREGKVRRSLADLEHSVLVFAAGEPLWPLNAAISFARGRLRRTRPALRMGPLDGLETFFTAETRRGKEASWFAWPNPAHEPWAQGAHGLLERTTAVGVMAIPDDRGLKLRAYALGVWDDPPTEALRRLEATVQDLCGSPLGHLTHLAQPTVPFAYQGDRDVLRVEGIVDAQKVAEGLYAATSAQLREIFERNP